jgi:hypothetical protein
MECECVKLSYATEVSYVIVQVQMGILPGDAATLLPTEPPPIP